jgi:hypothetical protein
MAASGGVSINTVHKWQQEEVLGLWFLILYSVHRWQQVVALALWLPSMAGGIHVLMFSFTGKEFFQFSTCSAHFSLPIFQRMGKDQIFEYLFLYNGN